MSQKNPATDRRGRYVLAIVASACAVCAVWWLSVLAEQARNRSQRTIVSFEQVQIVSEERAALLLPAGGEGVPIRNGEGARRNPHGIVVNEARIPVEDAVVAILSASQANAAAVSELREAGRIARSNTGGQWRASYRGTLEGQVVVARHRDYCAAIIALDAASEFPIRATLKRGQTISGRVVLPTGPGSPSRPIAGVTVVARGGNGGFGDVRTEVFARAMAQVQSAVTDTSGRFAIRGLREGSFSLHLIDANLAQGMVITRNGNPIQLDPVLVVQSGSTDVEIRATPLVAVVIRGVDAQSGHAVVQLSANAELPRGWRSWRRNLMDPRGAIMAGGEPYEVGSFEQGQGAVCQVMVPNRWPISVAAIPVWVRARGYEPQSVLCPVVPLRSLSKSRIEVRLKPRTTDMGSVAFRLRDSGGANVGDIATNVRLQSVEGESLDIAVRFDAEAVSAAVSVPSGRYRIVPGSSFEARAEFDVRRGTTATVGLVIADSVVEFDILDAATGRALDSVGVKVGRGEIPIQPRYERVDSRTVRMLGGWMQPPGMASLCGVVRSGFKPGRTRFEFYRYGYVPLVEYVELAIGAKSMVRVRMTRDASSNWDAWAAPANRFADVASSR